MSNWKDKIVKRFTAITINHDGQSLTIDCNQGWERIIFRAICDIQTASQITKCKTFVSNIKEKFGVIRIHIEPDITSNSYEEMLTCINTIERVAMKASSYVCEKCGSNGKLRKKYILKTSSYQTLCFKHYIIKCLYLLTH